MGENLSITASVRQCGRGHDLGANVEQLEEADRVRVESHGFAAKRCGNPFHLGHMPELVRKLARHGEKIAGVSSGS